MAVGAWFLISTVHGRTAFRYSDDPRINTAFYVITGFNLLLLIAMIPGAVWLWQLRPRGIVVLNCVSVLILLNPFVEGSLWLSPIGDVIAPVGGVANMGTAPVLFTGFPVLALVVLNVLQWRWRRAQTKAAAG